MLALICAVAIAASDARFSDHDAELARIHRLRQSAWIGTAVGTALTATALLTVQPGLREFMGWPGIERPWRRELTLGVAAIGAGATLVVGLPFLLMGHHQEERLLSDVPRHRVWLLGSIGALAVSGVALAGATRPDRAPVLTKVAGGAFAAALVLEGLRIVQNGPAVRREMALLPMPDGIAVAAAW